MRTENHEPIVSAFADDADMREIIDIFVQELPDRVEELRTACAQNNLDRIKTVAHQLKGAAPGYGFAPLGDAAAELEALLKSDEHALDDVRAHLDELITLCGRVRA